MSLSEEERAKKSIIIQDCGLGLVKIRNRGGILSFVAPQLLKSGIVEDHLLDRIATVLSIHRDEIVDSEHLDNGPGWIGVMLRDAEGVSS